MTAMEASFSSVQQIGLQPQLAAGSARAAKAFEIDRSARGRLLLRGGVIELRYSGSIKSQPGHLARKDRRDLWSGFVFLHHAAKVDADGRCLIDER
jgi:hypothetical protein